MKLQITTTYNASGIVLPFPPSKVGYSNYVFGYYVAKAIIQQIVIEFLNEMGLTLRFIQSNWILKESSLSETCLD